MIYLLIGIWLLLDIIKNISISVGVVSIGYFIYEKLDIYYQKWKIKKRNQRWEREHEKFMQRQRKWELAWKLRREERKKYPLFYWRENAT